MTDQLVDNDQSDKLEVENGSSLLVIKQQQWQVRIHARRRAEQN